jgi:hypothetical protein
MHPLGSLAALAPSADDCPGLSIRLKLGADVILLKNKVKFGSCFLGLSHSFSQPT